MAVGSYKSAVGVVVKLMRLKGALWTLSKTSALVSRQQQQQRAPQPAQRTCSGGGALASGSTPYAQRVMQHSPASLRTPLVDLIEVIAHAT